MEASPRVSKPAFVAKVNRICRHGWDEVLENYEEYSSWQSPKLTEKQLFTQVVGSSFLAGFDFHVFDAIRQIKAPKGEGEAVEAVIGELQEAVERGQRVTRVTTVPELNRLFADYNRAALRYGLDPECTVDGARLVEVQADRASRRINHIPSQ